MNETIVSKTTELKQTCVFYSIIDSVFVEFVVSVVFVVEAIIKLKYSKFRPIGSVLAEVKMLSTLMFVSKIFEQTLDPKNTLSIFKR